MEENNRLAKEKIAKEAKSAKWGRRAMVAGGGILLLLALAKSPFVQREIMKPSKPTREYRMETPPKNQWFEAPRHRYEPLTPNELNKIRAFLAQKHVQDSFKYELMPKDTREFSLLGNKADTNEVKLRDVTVKDNARTFVDKTTREWIIQLGQLIKDSTGFHVALDQVAYENGKKESLVNIIPGIMIRHKLKSSFDEKK